GFAKDHPLLEDLKRKDFIALAAMTKTTVTAKDFREQVAERFKQATPLMGYLCRALDIRF
ncbi:MAG: DUF2461 family protein, partial [Gallionella sp.]